MVRSASRGLTSKYADYRDILRDELKSRCKQNPRYSQGAFARDLDMRPNRLSEILQGKQGISVAVARRVAENLGFCDIDKEYFCDLVQSIHARSQFDRDVARIRVQKYKASRRLIHLQDDMFRVLTEWQHLALMELTKVKGFRNEFSWMARALRLPIAEVKAAIERLVRLNLMERRPTGLSVTRMERMFRSGIPKDLLRTFQAQFLEKAKESILAHYDHKDDEIDNNIEDEDGFSQSHIFSLTKESASEIKKVLARNVKHVRQVSDKSSGHDTVYGLTMQLFRVSSDDSG